MHSAGRTADRCTSTQQPVRTAQQPAYRPPASTHLDGDGGEVNAVLLLERHGAVALHSHDARHLQAGRGAQRPGRGLAGGTWVQVGWGWEADAPVMQRCRQRQVCHAMPRILNGSGRQGAAGAGNHSCRLQRMCCAEAPVVAQDSQHPQPTQALAWSIDTREQPASQSKATCLVQGVGVAGEQGGRLILVGAGHLDLRG